ncbi:MAG: D-alanyl-D-alanine carboxypeptidase/D-alanyl-D-alanine-endopeptidase (penicillin-binding protein 4) [Saprospiraceae bacterium]
MLTSLSCFPTKKLERALPNQIENSLIFRKSFTGFALLNPETGRFIYEYQSDKYFTPASNTKIFTLYTCLQILEEKPAVLRYQELDDVLIFQGTGNPTLLHPTLNVKNPTLDFLKNTNKRLLYNSDNFEEERFGTGWAWDDYPYYFQPEKSALPLYGNVVTFERDTLGNDLKIVPTYFKNKAQEVKEMRNDRPRINRKERENNFSYNEAAVAGKPFYKEIPYLTSSPLNLNLLSDTLNKTIAITPSSVSRLGESKVLYGSEIFPVYQKMMVDSDNFLAEQLLLMCADKQLGVLNSKKIIAFAKDSIFQDMPDELLWRDGSGLSRYNMFTPRTIARLLEKIHQELPEEQIFRIFPAGGTSGTVENWYAGKKEPYIFAKTGTLTGKHCLSGYVKTRSGKTLVFSFMHNNYKGSSKPLKVEMQRILEEIYEKY